MNPSLLLLALCQGLFLTNNVTFIAINGLVGLALAPQGWMATLPVMGYVVGGALSTGWVAKSQSRWGRKVSFQLGLGVAVGSALLAAYAVFIGQFWLLVLATVVAGYYSANGQLYRFAAAELTSAAHREKAVSWVMAGGLIGAVAGPNLAAQTKALLSTPFMAAYLALAGVALLGMAVMACIQFPPHQRAGGPAAGGVPADAGRPLLQIMRQPVFVVAASTAALSYGVMNLLMAATPLAMQVCGFGFADAAWVLEWHVIGMFAPGFFTGHLIKKWGTVLVMSLGVGLTLVCVLIGLSGQNLHQFWLALLLLGVGWNFVFTGSTTLAMQAWTAAEKDRGQAAINRCVFVVMAMSSLASGALVTSQGWFWLNVGSLLPVALMAAALGWLVWQRRGAAGVPR